MAPKRSPGSDPSSPPNDKRPRTDEQREHQQAQSAPTHATRTYNVSTGQAPAWDMGSPRQASSRPGSSSGPLDPHLTNRGADRAALDTRRRSTSNVPASVAVSSGCSMHQDGNGSNARSPTDSAVTATSGATEISHHSHVRTAPIAQMIPLPASGVPSQTTYSPSADPRLQRASSNVNQSSQQGSHIAPEGTGEEEKPASDLLQHFRTKHIGYKGKSLEPVKKVVQEELTTTHNTSTGGPFAPTGGQLGESVSTNLAPTEFSRTTGIRNDPLNPDNIRDLIIQVLRSGDAQLVNWSADRYMFKNMERRLAEMENEVADVQTLVATSIPPTTGNRIGNRRSNGNPAHRPNIMFTQQMRRYEDRLNHMEKTYQQESSREYEKNRALEARLSAVEEGTRKPKTLESRLYSLEEAYQKSKENMANDIKRLSRLEQSFSDSKRAARQNHVAQVQQISSLVDNQAVQSKQIASLAEDQAIQAEQIKSLVKDQATQANKITSLVDEQATHANTIASLMNEQATQAGQIEAVSTTSSSLQDVDNHVCQASWYINLDRRITAIETAQSQIQSHSGPSGQNAVPRHDGTVATAYPAQAIANAHGNPVVGPAEATWLRNSVRSLIQQITNLEQGYHGLQDAVAANINERIATIGQQMATRDQYTQLNFALIDLRARWENLTTPELARQIISVALPELIGRLNTVERVVAQTDNVLREMTQNANLANTQTGALNQTVQDLTARFDSEIRLFRLGLARTQAILEDVNQGLPVPQPSLNFDINPVDQSDSN